MNAPTGVVAKSQARANKVIHELGLTNARALPRRASSIDGMRLSAVIIDESALPLRDDVETTLRCNLLKTAGHADMYELRRLPDATRTPPLSRR